jgi:hypothetical protein
MTDRCVAAISRKALAFIFIHNLDAVSVEDAPIVNGRLDGVALAKRLRIIGPNLIVIEKLYSGHRVAVPQTRRHLDSVFASRVSFGIAQGVAAGLSIPSNEIAAAKWRRNFAVSNLEAVRKKAILFWPSRFDLFERPHHAYRAEAALLALYAARCIAPEVRP